MDKNFEAVIMNTYAEICVSWRMAHVAKLVKADDLNAKLTSLESVIKTFDLGGSPTGGGSPKPTPVKAGDRGKSGARSGAILEG
jgi:hypothetical protein